MTARDVAGALHLIEVARAGLRDPRFEIVIVTQQPAAAKFEAAGIAARVVAWPSTASINSREAQTLRDNARALLNEIDPAVIVTGLSTPFDASLDEAVLAEARVPTALYQDYWGEQN